MSLSLPEPAQPPGYGQLECLQKVLDDFPRLLTELQDPRDVEQAVGALKMLTAIQSRLMGNQGQASGPAAQG